MNDNYALIADIGATNARFALADQEGFHDPIVLQCEDYPGFADAARDYLSQVKAPGKPVAGSFAIAGPVEGDDINVTNNPWAFNIPQLKTDLDLAQMQVVNDFVAVALSVPNLKDEDYTQLGPGAPVDKKPIGILGAGTGLGVASLIWCGDRYVPVAGEGGHVTMSARTQREFDLFNTLHYKYRHVSAERVCSGKGLANLYNAIIMVDKRDDLPERTPEEISKAALDKSCPVCVEALDLMMGVLGTAAGNLALTIGAHGGIYIAGGIPAKLGDYFFNSRFREEFARKGRFESYLAAIPTYVITNPYTAFIGLQADLVTRRAI